MTQTLFDAAPQPAQVRDAMLLYAVTDRAWVGEASLADQVQAALAGGVTCVQLREKTLDSALFLEEAFQLGALCRAAGVPFIVNDNIGVALAADADGVHVGQDDMTCQEVRALVGPSKIIGVSVHTVDEALDAQAAGADYLGVGTMFPTSTKADAEAVTAEELRAICDAVDIPVVAIGGISAGTMDGLAGTGIDGVACVSAIFAASDIAAACKDLRAQATRVVASGKAGEGAPEDALTTEVAPTATFPPRPLQTAIFDFDGTLFDSMIAWYNAGPALLAQLGKEPKPELWDRFRTLSLEQAAVLMQEEYELALSVNEIMEGINKCVEDAYAFDVLPKPGAVEFVRRLRAAGVRCVIATASDRYLIESALRRCEIEDLFEDIFTCGGLNTNKREPLIFRTAMEAAGGTRENSVVFEDSLHCIETCKNDGFFTVAVADENETRTEQLQTLADYYVETFEDADDLLQALVGAESDRPGDLG